MAMISEANDQNVTASAGVPVDQGPDEGWASIGLLQPNHSGLGWVGRHTMPTRFAELRTWNAITISSAPKRIA